MRRLICLLIIIFCFTLMMCERNKETEAELMFQAVTAILQLNGPQYEGTYYQGYLPLSDYVFWIEDANQTYLKTISITPTVVTVSDEHGEHISHLPVWMDASGLTYANLEEETEDGVAPSFDGMTAASLSFTNDVSPQQIEAEWDLTDRDGDLVSPGIFYICAEAANLLKNDEENIEIVSESVKIQINLKKGTFQEITPTEHLLSMTITFEDEGQSLSKQSIIGP